ncbi:TPA: ead/Ea22-like family protein [Klebsiella pneumoniae subsp. pneumoniae]|nr:ead/Ea22-like family protein [Klebsiella pneumoniae subsp. pneumoniae]HDT4835234.1 ead/Ea22-like family protein [Klebsiella pneumoniae subsp. pneumoniae]
MTDITELAQSEINDALAQLKQISEYPTPSTQYARVLRKYITSQAEALEKAQQRIGKLEKKLTDHKRMNQEMAKAMLTPNDSDAAGMEIAALRQRIAELENYAEAEAVGADKVAENAVHWMKRCKELESRTVKLSPELYTIGELIRTQDNRITDQPMFVVFQKREIIGSDEHSPSRICWVWDGEEVSELRAKRLEALYQDGRDTRGYDRYAMQEVDEFVTACFTEHGCKDYLRQNGHNLRLPYIYACGSFRNNEYQLVRNWLAGIKVEAE